MLSQANHSGSSTNRPVITSTTTSPIPMPAGFPTARGATPAGVDRVRGTPHLAAWFLRRTGLSLS
jgi:hypothetical protein